jgi:endonuclease/exonuclease/phosphatase (EEP) superfamily protein YafD
MTLVRGGRIEPGRVLHVPPSQPYGMVNRVTVGGVGLVVANVHFAEMLGPPLLSFPFSEVFRLREACHLTRTLRRARVPVIAAGDFNTFWPAPATWPLRWHWRDCRRAVGGLGRATRPTYGLPFIIDNILVRGDADILDYEVIDGPGSDHRAIAATVRVVKSE